MSAVLQILTNKVKAMFTNRISVLSTVFDSEINKKAAVRQNVRLYHVKIGKYSYVCRDTLIQHTEVGAFCSISEGCQIGMSSHPTDFVSTSPVFLRGENYLHTNFADLPFEDCPTTVIGNDVWIGTGAKIKSGVKIGNGAVIGAGAVVTKDVEPYSIVGGIPAKLIRYRFDRETIEKVDGSQWWNLSDAELKNVSSGFHNVQMFSGKGK